MSDCIFCKIANKEIKSELIYEDDRIVAFKDLHPVSPVHLLIVPKKHYATLNDVEDSLVGEMAAVAKKLAAKNNIAESGYRVVMNVNKEGGQIVMHLHLHLIGGRRLTDAIG
jgi:histidine triad (HIT) family protein